MADDENASWLFGGDKGERGAWEAHRRFVSPEFNAIYRQGVVGPRHLKESDFALFLQEGRTPGESAANRFKLWYLTDRVGGGDYGDVAMERIGARAYSFDVDTAYGVVRVFADVMDDYYRVRPKREMFTDTWQQSEAILRTFHTSVPRFKLSEIAPQIAASGAAISWMCSAIVREELWRHGLAGDRGQDDSVRLLNIVSLQSFTCTIIERLSQMKSDDILGLPRLGGVMYTIKESPWFQAEVAAIITRLAGPRVPDAKFLQFLEAMAGVVVSSDRGAYYTISQKSVGGIIGDDRFATRWSRLLAKRLPDALAEKRGRIMKMMSEAKSW